MVVDSGAPRSLIEGDQMVDISPERFFSEDLDVGAEDISPERFFSEDLDVGAEEDSESEALTEPDEPINLVSPRGTPVDVIAVASQSPEAAPEALCRGAEAGVDHVLEVLNSVGASLMPCPSIPSAAAMPDDQRTQFEAHSASHRQRWRRLNPFRERSPSGHTPTVEQSASAADRLTLAEIQKEEREDNAPLASFCRRLSPDAERELALASVQRSAERDPEVARELRGLCRIASDISDDLDALQAIVAS